ncbi:MAG: outer membrane lipoprotein chaperone LolA [Alysiella sp.]|uniref:outer membrane lipoprotein chaperone LolA n=1 Tax=Alysiella sp. TaxID=1872483 RepID=UPI0026DBD7C2|nr:outer membrane lipoprotein chaperone LolA [Alysiella sp.]MDO4433750.1 outer membrane lipoprotein chaperone LolA [Alysiella sp.]
MKQGKTVLVTGLLAAFATFSVHASGIDALKRFNADTDGISGTFTQTVQAKNKKRVSSGSFEILRPGLFKWEYVQPDKQIIVADGKYIWFYDVELKQVTQSEQDQAIGGSPAAILSNKQALESSYALQEEGNKEGLDYVLATPKKTNAGYQFVRIGFKEGNLASMELKDSFGNQTRIHFANINTRPNLTRNGFQFTPPKNVGVLKQ